MGTKIAAVDSNLVAAYKEVKLFALLPQVCPQDFYQKTTSDFYRTFSINGLKILTYSFTI